MKVRITHLKSTAWPKNAKVGDVVKVDGDEIPGWALGKCVVVDDDAKKDPAAKKEDDAKKDPAA